MIYPVQKPRKRLENKAYIEFIMTKPCIFCGDPSNQPHHVRKGYGDGKGCASRKPDDYRALNNCHLCHAALEGTDSKRLEWMMAEKGWEDIYSAMLDNLIEFIAIRGKGI